MNNHCQTFRVHFFALLCLSLPLHAAYAEPEQWSRVSRALKVADSKAAKELSAQDRVILQATLALKSDQPDQALKLLNTANNQDPLVALLEAEAHRREAMQAVQQAGDYAKKLQLQGQLLASADLSRGLGEADARLHSFIDKLDAVNGNPFDILLSGSNMANVFMIDKARNRLYVFEPDHKGGLKKIADEYVVTGSVAGDKKRQGDARTPNGIYRFIQKLEDSELEARYGPVAFPIDYPNELDALHGKDGYGIWMHGYPFDVQRRPPQDTRGCFALSNARLLKMAQYVKLGRSWVIIGENLIFDQNRSKQALLKSVRRDIEAWRSDWASLDVDAYLSHYHHDFRSGKRDLAAWKRHKHRVNTGKTFVDVSFRDMTIIHDPNRWPEGEVVVAEFDQHYRSSNYSDIGRKRLYLARESDNSPWKILLEEGLAR
jgi:murein L,D-transpeptidase YafK